MADYIFYHQSPYFCTSEVLHEVYAMRRLEIKLYLDWSPLLTPLGGQRPMVT